MKQGTLINRIVMLVLFGAVVTFLAAKVWDGLTRKEVTTTSYSYTLDDSAEATGYLVRTEYILPVQSTLADVLPAEGEKVAVGETVAYLYRDAAALERKQDIRALNAQLEQLNYSLTKSDDLSDNAQLSADILTEIVTLRVSSADRDFTALEDNALNLKSLVYKRDHTNAGGDAAGIQESINTLNGQLQALTASAADDTTVLRTDRSGVFSGLVDGYEGVLTTELLEALTPSKLDRLSTQVQLVPEGTVGKLVTNSRWYFICPMSEAESKRLVEGNTVTVRFSRDWSGEVEMTVDRISEVENGRVAVTLSSTRFLSETTLLRRQTVEIVFSSVTGIRIPKNALYQDEEGQWGVYVKVSAQAEFKPITIVGDDGDYYLVQPLIPATDVNPNKAKKALRPGDEIIISADGLFDGKVIQ